MHDLLIIGHGLAGSVLADKALARGLDLLVIDAPREGRATPAAAGLVNPITLRRLVPSWRVDRLLPLAEAFYGSVADGAHWHRTELVKVHANEQARHQWQRAQNDPEASAYLVDRTAADVEAALPTPYGYGCVDRCAWLDVNGWLPHQRKKLHDKGCLQEHWIDRSEVRAAQDHVEVNGARARFAVLCEGPFATAMPGLVPVAGDVLTVRIPGLQLRSIVHGGVFLLPLPDGLFRVGSTFAWDDVFSGPRLSAREHLLTKLRELVPFPVEVVEHRWGVRPASKDRRPILGPVVNGDRVVAMNGLGARGVLLAPWCADHLLDHLFAGQPLDPEVNPLRFT